MLITRNQDPFRFGTSYSKPASAPTSFPQNSNSSADVVELGQSRPAPLTYVPTGAGTAAMGATLVGVGSGVGYLVDALTGNSGLGIAAGMLSGLAASFALSASWDHGAQETYAQTGQGSAWLQPVFSPEEITGLPKQAIGVRGLV